MEGGQKEKNLIVGEGCGERIMGVKLCLIAREIDYLCMTLQAGRYNGDVLLNE